MNLTETKNYLQYYVFYSWIIDRIMYSTFERKFFNAEINNDGLIVEFDEKRKFRQEYPEEEPKVDFYYLSTDSEINEICFGYEKGRNVVCEKRIYFDKFDEGNALEIANEFMNYKTGIYKP